MVHKVTIHKRAQAGNLPREEDKRVDRRKGIADTLALRCRQPLIGEYDVYSHEI